ncbi:MAG TPA: trypsin-like serine protease [Actinocrinis sp.]|jgi:V8-like Glu-specific endopeptidase|uniref:trypsin-like serine peptidase n=1 Tax=Actinocrinis sp. TaxID=1920516 RepID=UPI002DDD88A7|nr:trypsin-like serine protease [Actinocrinis sp.]HEV3169700.1 trypsin-like serine protease [Actinocrinis sp.]
MAASSGHTDQHRQRRRRSTAAVVCSGLLLAVATGLLTAGAKGAQASSGRARPGASQGPRGVLPVAQPEASRAAAYWSERLESPEPSAQPAVPRPGSSGTAHAVAGAQPPRTPSPTTDGKGAASDPASADADPPQVADPPAMTASDPLAGTAFTGLPQVGAIFSLTGGQQDGHYCSGSVVASPAGDIVVTAAHCVYSASDGSYYTDIAFVPGYHDGEDPYGVWTPSTIVVDPQWMNDADPDYDVAFLTVHQSGSNERIQDAVGADALGAGSSPTALTRVIGYPDDTEQPITCTNFTKAFSATQLEFDCAGFPGGTSGGPFLTGVDPVTGLGTVVGVIGGYEEGGDTPDVSYSVAFGDTVAQLFARAEAAG